MIVVFLLVLSALGKFVVNYPVEEEKAGSGHFFGTLSKFIDHLAKKTSFPIILKGYQMDDS